MAAPLYFLAGLNVETLTRDTLTDLGLADRWRDLMDSRKPLVDLLAHRLVRKGPDGLTGVVVCPLPCAGTQPQLGVFPHQTWQQIGDGVYLGWSPDDPPTPLDLLRPVVLNGHETTLGSHVWQVPVIRRGGLRPALPQVLTRKNGRVEMQLRREWEPVWKSAGRMWDLLTTVQAAEWEEVYDLCRLALQINYRVDDAELELLQAIDTGNFQQVFQAVCDWPLVESMLAQQFPGETPTANPPEAAPAAA